MTRQALLVVPLGFWLLLPVDALPAAEFRIAAYNTLNNPDSPTEDAWFRTILSAIGNEQVQGLAKRLDAIALAETDAGSANRLVDILNGLYGVDTYDVVTSSSDGGGDRTGVVFDSSTLTLLDWTDLPQIGWHTMMRARFRPAGSIDPAAEFHLYSLHLQWGNSPGNRDARAAEINRIRNDADALGQRVPIIYAGDFNMSGSSEGAWSGMLSAGNGQAFDAADSPGEWRNNPAFKHLHSRDAAAGMDGRFDFHFLTDEFFDGQGWQYAADSFHVFANNATHTLGGPITTGTAAPPHVLSALAGASDHLPVVADYRYTIPEPTTATLLAAGAIGILGWSALRRRRCRLQSRRPSHLDDLVHGRFGPAQGDVLSDGAVEDERLLGPTAVASTCSFPAGRAPWGVRGRRPVAGSKGPAGKAAWPRRIGLVRRRRRPGCSSWWPRRRGWGPTPSA